MYVCMYACLFSPSLIQETPFPLQPVSSAGIWGNAPTTRFAGSKPSNKPQQTPPQSPNQSRHPARGVGGGGGEPDPRPQPMLRGPAAGPAASGGPAAESSAPLRTAPHRRRGAGRPPRGLSPISGASSGLRQRGLLCHPSPRVPSQTESRKSRPNQGFYPVIGRAKGEK